ncbi:hypothetical protein FNV61_18800 [Streptomyces sp. RLB3-6]|nr:hypothetical protein FNV61_18800 [Streptomyces sp. RLB3-6]
MTVPRPTERAAIRAASWSERPLPSVSDLLDAAVIAHRASDKEGVGLCLHLAVRSALSEVDE